MLGVIASIALIVVGFPLILARMRPGEKEHGWVSGDDLDIRLVAVRPDAGDDLYDAAGKRIEGDATGLWTAGEAWTADQQRRDFIFTVPETEDEILFSHIHLLRPAGTTTVIGGGGAHEFGADDGHGLILFQSCSRSYPKRVLRLFRTDAPVDAVDLTLRYFHGPSLEGGYRFEGPFSIGATVAEASGKTSTLYVAPPRPSYAQPDLIFTVLSSAHDAANLQPLVYDKDGRRRLGYLGSYSLRPGAFRGDIIFSETALEDIAVVALEMPRERTFHDIVVSYPDRLQRTRAPYLDRMAEALGKTALTDRELAEYSFASAEEALKVVDIVRGIHAYRAGERLCSRRVDFKDLDQATLEKVRRAADSWSVSYDAEQRVAGITLALKAGWAEYVPRIFEILDDEDWEVRTDAARLFHTFNSLLDASHVESIVRVLQSTGDPDVCRELMTCLLYCPLDECREARERLSKSDKAWLWWPALGRRWTKELGDPDQWDDTTKARLALNPRRTHPALESVTDDQLENVIVEMLTPDICYMQYEAFKEAAERGPALLERDRLTALLADFLNAALEKGRWGGMRFDEDRNHQARRGICLAARLINGMHAVDIGGLGSDINAPGPDQHGHDWAQIACDAVAWCRTGALPGTVPDAYRAAVGDLRVIWKETSDAESSMISLWTPSIETPGEARLHRLESNGRFTAWRLRALDDGSGWALEWECGAAGGWATRNVLLVSRQDLPMLVFPPADENWAPWASEKAPWEIYVEPADSPQSVLYGTKVFEDWWEEYGPDVTEEVPADTPTSVIAPEDEMDKRKEALLERIER